MAGLSRLVRMRKNERALDRVLRLALSAIAGAVARETTGTLSKAMWGLSGIMAVTGLTGWCPLYRIFGISTCKVPPVP